MSIFNDAFRSFAEIYDILPFEELNAIHWEVELVVDLGIKHSRTVFVYFPLIDKLFAASCFEVIIEHDGLDRHIVFQIEDLVLSH